MKKYPAPRDAWVFAGGVFGHAKSLAEQGVPEREIRKAWSVKYQRIKKREKMRDIQIVHIAQIRRTGN